VEDRSPIASATASESESTSGGPLSRPANLAQVVELKPEPAVILPPIDTHQLEPTEENQTPLAPSAQAGKFTPTLLEITTCFWLAGLALSLVLVVTGWLRFRSLLRKENLLLTRTQGSPKLRRRFNQPLRPGAFAHLRWRLHPSSPPPHSPESFDLPPILNLEFDDTFLEERYIFLKDLP